MSVFVILSLALSFAAPLMREIGNWLDQPLANWNIASDVVPNAVIGSETRDALLKRCGLVARQTSANERRLVAAGWIPFLRFDRNIAQGDVEVVHAMNRADQNCQPADFNAFVFVGGRFAGTLSPTPINAGRDGSIGAVRLIPPDLLTADFARYTSTDSECCPSSHVAVRYRIDRSGTQPLIVPFEVRTTRG